MKSFDHETIEARWREAWKEARTYAADDKRGDKFYVLVELAYSSGNLHIGHWFGWTAPDVYARFKRMQGKNVLFPVGGFDSFGLPAENAAIKHGVHPEKWTNENIETMRRQFELLGPSFDWEKEVVTSSPEYYRWTQWLFLKLYERGLAYRDKVTSNWCPECKTVLANEHVEDGKCWRHGDVEVVQKEVDQWLVRITDYADKLIWPTKEDSKSSSLRRSSAPSYAKASDGKKASAGEADWPKEHVDGQNNWIGRKEGVVIHHKVIDLDMTLDTFSAFPAWLFADTYLVIAPEHPIVSELVKGTKQEKEVKSFIEESKKMTTRERNEDKYEKKGVFTGRYVVDPFSGNKMPVWLANFALMEFGTGMIRCSAHDPRDFEFAQKYGIDLKEVVDRIDDSVPVNAHGNKGALKGSGKFSGREISDELISEMVDWIVEENIGKREVSYHLHDWSISRHRYWGAPVPVIYCGSNKCLESSKSQAPSSKQAPNSKLQITDIDGKECVIHPVPLEDLPVELPRDVDYMPTGKAPLATAPEFVEVKCPECGGQARRETETMDTYVDSSWYFLRYPSPKYDKGVFDEKLINQWLPLDVYFGGREHVYGHTLYARFITKFLKDIGMIGFDEFAKKRVNHGDIMGPDGSKMSKSRGNVVNPEKEAGEFGADAVRLYLCFMGPHQNGAPWNRSGVEAMRRFLDRVWKLAAKVEEDPSAAKAQAAPLRTQDDDADVKSLSASSSAVQRKLHWMVKKVTEDLEKMKFNTAVAAMMEFLNVAEKALSISKSDLLIFVRVLAVFAPFVAEELYQTLQRGNAATLQRNFESVHRQAWPEWDEELVKEDVVTVPVQVNGKVRSTLEVSSPAKGAGRQKLGASEEEIVKLAKDDGKVKKWLEGKEIKKVIWIAPSGGRKGLLNLVV